MFILVFIATILILVLVHEFGHFWMAKRFNIKVLEFGFGLPPRIWGKKVGETLFSVNALPIGGFVRPLGEDEEVDLDKLPKGKREEWTKRSFQSQRVSKKIVVVAAGVVMNLLLAFALYYITLSVQGLKVQVPLLVRHQFVGVVQRDEQMVVIGEVAKGSPAEQANLKAGERIVKIDGEQVQSSGQLVLLTKERAGQEVSLTVSDPQGTQLRTVRLTPRKNPPPGQGAIGVSLGSFTVANLDYQSPWQKLLSGPIHSYNLAAYSFQILGQTIQTAFVRRDLAPVSQSVAGPVGITSIVKDILAIKNPLIPYLEFMAALSLNLAIVNVLPFPGLDGGRLLFLAIEGIFRRRVNQRVERYVHTVGLVLLLTLVLLITFSDIKKLF